MRIQFFTTAPLDHTNPASTKKEHVHPVKAKIGALAEIIKAHGKYGAAGALLPAGYLIHRFMTTSVDKQVELHKPLQATTATDAPAVAIPLEAAKSNQTIASLVSTSAVVDHSWVTSLVEHLPSAQTYLPLAEKALTVTKAVLPKGRDLAEATSGMEKTHLLGLALLGTLALGLTARLMRRWCCTSSYKKPSNADITFSSNSYLQKRLRRETITAADIGLPLPSGLCSSRNTVHIKLCAGKNLETLKSIYLGLLRLQEVDDAIVCFRSYLKQEYFMDNDFSEADLQEELFTRMLVDEELEERIKQHHFITAENVGLPVPAKGQDANEFYHDLFKEGTSPFCTYGNFINVRCGQVVVIAGLFDANLTIALAQHKARFCDVMSKLTLKIPDGYDPTKPGKAITASDIGLLTLTGGQTGGIEYYKKLFGHFTPEAQAQLLRILSSLVFATDVNIINARCGLKALLPYDTLCKINESPTIAPEPPITPASQSFQPLSPEQAAVGTSVLTPAGVPSLTPGAGRPLGLVERG